MQSEKKSAYVLVSQENSQTASKIFTTSYRQTICFTELDDDQIIAFFYLQ